MGWWVSSHAVDNAPKMLSFFPYVRVYGLFVELHRCSVPAGKIKSWLWPACSAAALYMS